MATGMSHPAASGTYPAVGSPPAAGRLFRLHPIVRRDILAGSGVVAITCMGLALVSLQAFPGLHTPLSILLILGIEVGGLAVASACSLWALGLAVLLDHRGVRITHLLFPGRRGRGWDWEELEGVVSRPWLLARLPGYPARRLQLLPREGAPRALPPLEEQGRLLELLRSEIRRRDPAR